MKKVFVVLKMLVVLYRNRKVLAELTKELKDLPEAANAVGQAVKKAMADGKLKNSEKDEIADKNMALLTEMSQVIGVLYKIKL